MTTLTLRRLLASIPEGETRVVEALGRWKREPRAAAPPVDVLAEAMEDERLVEARLQELPQKLFDLLDVLLAEPGKAHGLHPLFQEHGSRFKSRFDLEASLAALEREGFLFRYGAGTNGDRAWVVPGELAGCIATLRRRQQSELRETITLKGFLEARYFDADDRGDDDPDAAAEHARKIFKFYLTEGSIKNRVRQLPAPVRAVFLLALTHHGGVMPWAEVPAELSVDDGEEPRPDLDLVRKCLEESMLGTVSPLRLARFGIQPVDEAVVLFQEIVLIGLPLYSSVHGVEVDAALCSGVDFVSNVGRFLRELQCSKVQFTVDGELYKASQKRIMRTFLEISGGFMPAETQIRTIFEFCKTRRLVDRSGERALRPTAAGMEFERLELNDKLRKLLTFALQERDLPGEYFHQAKLRSVLMRLLKRSEPEQWHEIQFLPLLARNSYLTQLERHKADTFFAARFKGGGYTPTEDLQQICWNLLLFVKRRLYPLGLVDLGMRDGRPVALRLSRLGAALLSEDGAGRLDGARSSVVVNPDFEVIVFPGDDEHQVVHEFDRFATRLKTDHIHHFRLSRESFQSGLRDGLNLSHVIHELGHRSRAPLPQNVVYSLEEWADQAGWLELDGAGVVHGRRAEIVDRFLALPQIREHVRERVDPTSARIEGVDWEQVDGALRDQGFLVERRPNDEPAD